MNPLRTVVHACAVLLLASSVQAQPPAQAPVVDTTKSDSREGTNQQKDWHFLGHVEFEDKDTKIYADDAWYYEEGSKFIAKGNVVFAQADNRISAERIEFNTETRLGTFYNAYGISTVKPPRQQVRSGGIAPPPMAGQDTVVYFFGESIEKLGPKKYKISKGGFSTCVQPTPRWDLVADTVTLNVDHYTFLKQAVLRVKGVPMFYLPVLYYPTKKEDRATGFLLPSYGSSTLRGQSIHNAFFWAIDRSQDATVFHDWYSNTGQGVGSEYRYNFGGGDDGTFKAYMLNEHNTTVVDPSGAAPTGSRSFELRGGANQLLPGHLRARASVNYFSSLATSQTLNTNIYDQSRNTRDFGGNIVGAWGTYTLNSTIRHSEYFSGETSSTVLGDWPRVAVSRNERPLLKTPMYFSVGTEYVHFVRTGTVNGVETDSRSLSRIDFYPQIRYPFKKWQWFTVNTTASWHETYYSRSLTPKSEVGQKITDEPLTRPVFNLQANMLGPLFSRIWDTPENGYAEKFKHAIEPFLNIQKTFNVPNFDRVVVLDGTDYFLGGETYNYGINNRFYAKHKATTPGGLAQAREIVSVELSQSYYSTPQQSLYDRNYQSNNIPGATDVPASNFSAVALSVRAMPTNQITANMRAEFDPRYHSLRMISASGSYSWANLFQFASTWSKRGFIPQLPGFNDPNLLDQAINAQTTVHTANNRVGGIYSFNYDILHKNILQQRLSGFYNAQCCGIAFEYQTVNWGSLSNAPITSDHRFFMSFTLAGLGNFSPFNGALGGVPR
ncbi:MAG TPA: putative LPS assembly protein LptD [Vicinamibacterales bacterium]|nr:putative LPS assembly protein LptD [Vicinamibacterales bacterium]